ncbi:MAG: diacylglycerol kinase family lipid kinase [Clostridia bacterium]|nr:diacylglycerol kinase family lipid kinase [Clostridia bacterium]
MKNLLLIVNPRSGRAKMGPALLSVVEIFSKADYSVTVYPTKEREDATRKVETLKTGDYDLIVVCGGDGTLNEVITGLMRSSADVPIGYIPAGTLNEWSTGLGISKVIRTAAKDIVKGKEITLDIGKFGDKYFTYTASFGAFTSASYSANQDIKNVLGQAAYFFEGIKSLGAIKPIHLKFEADGRVIEDNFLFGAVSNSMSVGGIVKFDQSVVKLNDGLFEVLLIKNPSNILKLQPMLDGILKQELNRDGMEFFHTSKITVTNGEGLDWTLDGEKATSGKTLEITNCKNAVRFIVPKKGEK